MKNLGKSNMTTSETYLRSWENELKESLKQQEQRQKKGEDSSKKIQTQLKEQTLQLKAIDDNLRLITEQMKTSLHSYCQTQVKRLEKLDDTKDLKAQGEALFTVFKDLYDDACLFFSRNQFQVLSSPLQEIKESNLMELWQSFWKKDHTTHLEDENWLSYKNSLWSLKVYHQDLVHQLDHAQKENQVLLEKEKTSLQEKTKIDLEVKMLQKQLNELSTFSEKLKSVQLEVEPVRSLSPDPPVTLPKKNGKTLSPIPEVEKTDTEE